MKQAIRNKNRHVTGTSSPSLTPKSSTSKTISPSPTLNMEDCENKIQTLLLELFQSIKAIEKERKDGSVNLEAIAKSHEKVQGEQKLSGYYRQKLSNLYTSALQDADSECDLLKSGLDIISQIKALQEEKRIALRITNSNSGDEQPRKSMRRGVLMSMLQKSAQTLPLWIGKPGESIPSLCGALGAGSDYTAKPGDKVAARVKTDEPEEQWILAEVVSFNSINTKYEVDDIDEEGRERHILSKRRVVPLPQWKANPETDPEALFTKGTFVMALYPQTTCFYRAIICEQPRTAHDDYSVLFEDSSYADGYSPALCVAQKYVVVPKEFKDTRKR